MFSRVTIASSLLLIGLCSSPVTADEWTLNDMVGKDARGRVIYRAQPIDQAFRNPISTKDEEQIQARARLIIESQSQKRVSAGNTYFENEKRTYGYLMAQALGERGMAAIKDLQNEDAQAKDWHRETQGIDFYAAFTLKHQMRKYFYFGDLLDKSYKQRMFQGAKSWTAKDPLRRHHHAFKKPGGGWGPDQKDSWVDVRSTENLFLMRVTSVYLMAEETGNQQPADLYKQLILDYTKTLYRIGLGEWDSENYHGHSIPPLCNLYDFAKDKEVKLAAKACLDWLFAAGAVKYYRGGFNGPTKRDYNHVQPFGGSAACMLWVYFGNTPQPNSHWESDEVHLITSAYRPPPAVMEFARKEFRQPVEVFSAKPQYAATTSLDSKSPAEYLETQYLSQSYQMGSLAGGTRPGKSDVNGFKILVYDKNVGARTIQGVPGSDPRFVGSPQYQTGKVSAENRVAQYRNLAVWLVADGRSPWRWVIPESVAVQERDGITFMLCDRTFIALRPLGTSALKVDEAATRGIADGEKARFPAHKVLAATGQSKKFCGFAIHTEESKSFKNFAAFQQHVLNAELDTEKLEQGVVQYKTGDLWLGFHWNDNPHNLGVWRNGQRHDYTQHARHLYATNGPVAGKSQARIVSPRGSGQLYVEANGQAFFSEVDESGQVTFHNGKPAELRTLMNAAD